jgi:mRNA interferase MazF
MKRGDIVLVKLPESAEGSGHEQVGTRPALIVHNDETSESVSVIMIVPFTSNLKAGRFSHTILVQPSKENGLAVPSVLLVFQLRAVDKSRIARKIGRLESKWIKIVNKEIRNLLGL